MDYTTRQTFSKWLVYGNAIFCIFLMVGAMTSYYALFSISLLERREDFLLILLVAGFFLSLAFLQHYLWHTGRVLSAHIPDEQPKHPPTFRGIFITSILLTVMAVFHLLWLIRQGFDITFNPPYLPSYIWGNTPQEFANIFLIGLFVGLIHVMATFTIGHALRQVRGQRQIIQHLAIETTTDRLSHGLYLIGLLFRAVGWALIAFSIVYYLWLLYDEYESYGQIIGSTFHGQTFYTLQFQYLTLSILGLGQTLHHIGKIRPYIGGISEEIS